MEVRLKFVSSLFLLSLYEIVILAERCKSLAESSFATFIFA